MAEPTSKPEPDANAKSNKSKALWGGRFASGPSPELLALSRSTHFDWRLATYDLLQTRAHAGVLRRAELLTDEEFAAIAAAIDDLGTELAAGLVGPDVDDEDVHTGVERILVERLGTVGGKLRAGRSRNDQIATDFRLYLRTQARAIAQVIVALQTALIDQASEHVDSPAPGFTHLQRAQPVSFGHELAKHVHAFARDLDRLADWDVRTAVSPLGSGALSGSALPLDPEKVAVELGFDRAAENSIDAVSDRDFVAEFLFVAAMMGVHLSRLGEEVCLWTSKEFGWAKLHDSWSTGSSIMPQKKNPDIAELARGKAGRLIGDLTGLLATLKALPFAYNRDLQEDKEPAFDAVDTILVLTPAVTGMIATLEFDTERMVDSAPGGHALATEIADWLVAKGVPFRSAHEIAGACVKVADDQGVELWELDDQTLLGVSSELDASVRDVLSVAGALATRTTAGGTGPIAVRRQIERLAEGNAKAAAWAAVPAIPAAPEWLG
ncbi:MAG: argininosuccinate lyase [Actinobacteria bacterium]|nr:argininosuccinate lyase [Actinomycetota bacterium]